LIGIEKKGKLKDQYEIKFADGTIFRASFNTSETDPQRYKELTKDLAAAQLLPHIAGPWNYSTYIDTHTTPDKSGNYVTGPSWEFQQGISYLFLASKKCSKWQLKMYHLPTPKLFTV
jgi:hypothetical protein